jgi:hypothetical protein
MLLETIVEILKYSDCGAIRTLFSTKNSKKMGVSARFVQYEL